MFRRLIVVALGAALLVTQTPAGAAPRAARVGSAPRLPAGARVIGPLAGSTHVAIAVTLEPNDSAALQSYADAVSTPGTTDFRHYLSVAQFRARFAPSDAQIAAVRSALTADDLTVGAVAPNGLLIDASGTAAQMATAFSTSFEQVRLASGRTAFANTAAPQLPGPVAPTVQGVFGLDSLATPRPADLVRSVGPRRAHRHEARVLTGGPQPCAAAVTAEANGKTSDLLASAYGFSGLYQAGDEGAGQSIGLYELEPYLASDIAQYQTCYGTSATVTDVPVDGGVGVGPGEGEAALDVEVALSLAPKAKIITYSGPGSTNGFIDVYEAMVSDDKAQVLSTSWGYGGCDPYIPANVTAAEATAFAEAAAQGQTFLSASGDVGSDGCIGNTDSHGTPTDPGPELQDPSGQSLVTSVGGTELTSVGPPPTETTWNDDNGASSGGISALDTMPDYQLDASPSLNIIGPHSSGTPCSAAPGELCREAPDVSANADPSNPYVVYLNGGWTGFGGTSASSPLWAALLALANASSACHGTNIGFANPLLYGLASTAYASDFYDVTTGNNDASQNNPGHGYADEGGLYPAGVKFDMATGLGSPNGTNLAAGLCAGKVGSITVTNPGAQTGTVGTAVSLPVHASEAASAQLSYGAASLPAGLSIDPSTGAISGTPTTAGVSTVTVTVADSYGSRATAVFGWQINAPQPTVTSVSPASGPAAGGISVTITGTGLANATGVQFGSTAAPISGDTSTSITATAPGGAAGVVDVTVTTPGGTSAASGADQFTYVAPTPPASSPPAGGSTNPAPPPTTTVPTTPAKVTIAKLSIRRGPTTGRSRLTITGSGFVTGVIVRFGKAKATIISVTPTKIVVRTPKHAKGTVVITVTTPAGVKGSSKTRFTFAAPAKRKTQHKRTHATR